MALSLECKNNYAEREGALSSKRRSVGQCWAVRPTRLDENSSSGASMIHTSRKIATDSTTTTTKREPCGLQLNYLHESMLKIVQGKGKRLEFF